MQINLRIISLLQIAKLNLRPKPNRFKPHQPRAPKSFFKSMPFLNPNIPAVILAPMEGITDAPMRALLTRSGYYDYCVSEFIRVSENVLSPKIFKRHIPELNQESKTSSQISVQVQLLGGNAENIPLELKKLYVRFEMLFLLNIL